MNLSKLVAACLLSLALAVFALPTTNKVPNLSTRDVEPVSYANDLSARWADDHLEERKLLSKPRAILRKTLNRRCSLKMGKELGYFGQVGTVIGLPEAGDTRNRYKVHFVSRRWDNEDHPITAECHYFRPTKTFM
ncbi:hypothetical protein DACRYDRAFT_112084 [Dacryopinax primogenitus]|uniref:Uncharacterized protein n=1 Tax=Dacryopinax primogenitus (strain DJM 731) TaxID=1858805 RepID=M5FQS4_DACPD|nr:uncharacterized protein DACRYDRAFT_112084 [Dacryopinax primogenitus]EJT97124.1 hypothetical protein DACRYDRAFT_112084 [Dacryopinax primogenitus]